MADSIDTTKKSISYPQEIEDIIQQQVDAGIAESRSDWFQEAAYIRLSLQDLAAEAQGAKIRREPDTDE